MRGERFPLLLHSRRLRSLDEALDLARIWLSVASSWACWAPASAAIRFHSTGKKDMNSRTSLGSGAWHGLTEACSAKDQIASSAGQKSFSSNAKALSAVIALPK